MNDATEPATIGVIGAGRLGSALARLAVDAGYEVLVAGSGPASAISLILEVLIPGAEALTVPEVAARADVVILAMPFGAYRSLPADLFDGTLVIDATNYWSETDGPREDLVASGDTSSEAIQDHFRNAHVVKGFNHVGYRDLREFARPSGSSERKGIAIAGDDPTELEIVGRILDRLGFDDVPMSPFAAGRHLEPGSSIFGASLDATELRSDLLTACPR